MTAEVASRIRIARCCGWRVIAVNDAYRLLRYADILYACDWAWWKAHDGAKDFHGERWTSHSEVTDLIDDKSLIAGTYPLHFVRAQNGIGFSKAHVINYGICSHSGFHAVNLALILGCSKVVLCGFDMRRVDGESHFFGDHPEGLRNHAGEVEDQKYLDFIKCYPPDGRIVNATPDSALKVYEFQSIDQAFAGSMLIGHRAIVADGASGVCAA